MSKEIRRLHRNKTVSTNSSSIEAPELSNLADSTKPRIKHYDLPASVQTKMPISSSDIGNNDINTIRADLLEDAYHSKFAESDFSDDTHDWGGDSQLISDDYWHFLGRFE